jgi:hypothetical protein
MFLFELVSQQTEPFSSSLWTKAVVTALHRANVDTLHASLVDELHALDRMCHQWFARYGGALHSQRHTELDDHLTLLVPIVERLSMMRAAFGEWRISSLVLDDNLSLVRYEHNAPRTAASHHRTPVAAPLLLAASFLMDDASRNWKSAAALMQQLVHSTVDTRPSPTIVNSRAKDAFRRYQVAYAAATAVLALPLTSAEILFDAARLRDISAASAAAAQYLFASSRDGEQHTLLASLSAHAAQLCGACKRYDEQWDSVMGSALSAASYKHRADGALAASLKSTRVIPDMALVLGLLREAARHMADATAACPLHQQSPTRHLLHCIFPTAVALQHDISALLAKQEHENTLIYHETPMLRHQLGAVDVEKHDSKPTNVKLYDKAVEWGTTFRGPNDINVLHNRNLNVFLKFGPSLQSFASPPQTCNNSAPSHQDSDDDDSGDDAFHDAESTEDALHRLFATELPAAVAEVVLDDVPSYTQTVRSVMSSIDGFQLVVPPTVGAAASEAPINDVPWWLADMGNTLSVQFAALRTDVEALHEERKRFITANVQSPHENLAEVEGSLQAWFANTRDLLAKDCTHLPTTQSGRRLFVPFAGLHVEYALRHCPATGGPVQIDALRALRLLLSSSDSTWGTLFEGADTLANAADVDPSTFASFQLLLKTARQSWTASKVSTVFIKRYFNTMFVEAGRLRELIAERRGTSRQELKQVRDHATAVAPATLPSTAHQQPPAQSGGGVRVGSRLKGMLGDRKRPRDDE